MTPNPVCLRVIGIEELSIEDQAVADDRRRTTIDIGFTVATAAILAAAAIAGTARVFLRLTGLGRPAPAN
jgi:hypothetical protein